MKEKYYKQQNENVNIVRLCNAAGVRSLVIRKYVSKYSTAATATPSVHDVPLLFFFLFVLCFGVQINAMFYNSPIYG